MARPVHSPYDADKPWLIQARADAVAAASAGGGSLTLETPTGAVNGSNDEFVFTGTPVAVFRNGVMYAPDEFSVTGTTVTLDTPPSSGVITGLTQ